MPEAPGFDGSIPLRFYTIDSADAGELVSMRDDAEALERALHLMPGAYFANADFATVFEAYTGILDDHDVDLSGNGGHRVAEKFAEAEGDWTTWFGFEGNEATRLGKQLKRLKISDADVENYFGSEGEEMAEVHGKNLRDLHAWFQSTLAGMSPDQLLLARIVT
jgi:hypothetical protein